MARSGQKAKIEQILLATIADELSGFLFAGKEERPESLLALLLDIKTKEDKKCKSFNSSAGFEEWWNNN